VEIQRSFEASGSAGPHNITYMDWGDKGNLHAIFCVHGLTRNSRDFDSISKVLSEDHRVICMDVAGRGDSDWLSKPEDYGYPQYVADALALLEHLGCERVDWLGTSMGGILGMMIAALPDSPIKRLIINDIGPFIPNSALKRISEYLSDRPAFPSLAAFETHLRAIHAPFGPLTNEQWHHLSTHSARQLDATHWDFKYDPAIAIPFAEIAEQDIDLWEVWDAISCPILLLRGANSDVLPREIAKQAQARGPKATVRQFDNIGHAPALMAADQIDFIKNWLSG